MHTVGPGIFDRPSVMVAPPFVPVCITPKCLASTREQRRSDPHDNSRDSSSSHIWWRLDRLTVNPKYRLIIFLKEDLAGLTSMSEGVGDWDDGGDVGGGR